MVELVRFSSCLGKPSCIQKNQMSTHSVWTRGTGDSLPIEEEAQGSEGQLKIPEVVVMPERGAQEQLKAMIP